MQIKRLTLFWKRFTPLEAKILSEVQLALSQECGHIFKAQIAAINLVQRHIDWSEVLFYRKKGKRIDWSDILSFPIKKNLRLAKVDFYIDHQSYQATVNCIFGHILSLTFSPAEKPIAFREWDGKCNVELLEDPMDQSAAIGAETIPRKWARFLDENRQNDYPGWQLYDSTQARRISVHGNEMLVLAEGEGDQFIVCFADQPDSDIYEVSHEDWQKTIITSIRDYLNHYI